MNVEPRLYQRGKRGTWWVDLGEVSGIRHRRSTGTASRERAGRIARSMADELARHDAAVRVSQLIRPPSIPEWLEIVSGPTGRSCFDKLWSNARGRARRDGLIWSLGRDDLDQMAKDSGGKCAVTGLAFVIDGARRNPLRPSIDRLDNSSGYSRGNCRLTLMAVNYAMNVWGEHLFATIALSYASRRLEAAAQESHTIYRDVGNGSKPLI